MLPSGSTVTISPSCTLAFDANHTWRMRAVLGSSVGPWSAATTFKSPLGGFLTGNSVYDPLYNGTTVGQAVDASFIPNVGLRLNQHTSRVTYALPTNLQQGEFSVMVTGIDEGNAGDKTKIFSMQEGTGDITDNDYRMTVEKRGRQYEVPGAVTWRIIMGDAGEHDRIIDGDRLGIGFSDERWYFWKFTWGTGRAELIVREDGPNGRVIYNTSRGTGGFLYRPVPHVRLPGLPSWPRRPAGCEHPRLDLQERVAVEQPASELPRRAIGPVVDRGQRAQTLCPLSFRFALPRHG